MKHIKFTNKGQRKLNQDVISINEINPENWLYLIADGMGGYADGELAAKIVVENITTYLSSTKNINKKEIQIAVNKANLAIKQQKNLSQLEMGATVGGVIVNGKGAKCFWVGDVKILSFRKNKLIFESEEHTLINQLKNSGSITDVSRMLRYKHIVTKSIQGNIEKSKIGYLELDFSNNEDLIFICSDGVHNIIDGLTIEHILSTSANLDTAFETMMNRLKLESIDNASLIVINTV